MRIRNEGHFNGKFSLKKYMHSTKNFIFIWKNGEIIL